MGESAVKSAALCLGKLAVEEIKYLDGVSGKVERLSTELNSLAAFLADVVRSGRPDNLVQTTLAVARNVAYDCEDVIETYILEVARHGYKEYEAGCHLGAVMRWACLLWKAVSVHEIGSKIDELKDRISALKSSITSYVVPARVINANPTHPQISESSTLRRVYTHERDECVVVGLESQVEELVERLTNPTDQTLIVICGMGGVGKSTLARELYHHLESIIGGCFDSFGWATASQQFQPDRVLRTLLYSLVPEDDRGRRAKIDEDIIKR